MRRVYPDYETLSLAVADYIIGVGTRAVAARGIFTLALCGGRTPSRAYEMLSHPVLRDATHFYWGDERCVPPNDPASNYRVARIAMLDRLQVRPDHVHRIEAEAPDPADAASRYDAQFPARLDLLLLGVGADGHTASIFPGSSALDERRRRFVAVEAPSEPRSRITITPAGIAAASDILVIVSGAEKAEALRRVFAPIGDARLVPARLVRDADWITDSAAGQLPG